MKSISALSLLSIFALTACGGGGSSGSGKTEPAKPINNMKNPAPVTTTESKPTPQITKPVTQGPKEPTKQPEATTYQPDTIHGNYLVGASRNNTGYTSFPLSGKNLDYLTIYGRKIPLFDPAQKPVDGWNTIGNGFVSSKEQLSYSRHGAFQHGSDIYIFAQGESSEKVPTQGKFTYQGEATIITVQGKDVFPDLKDKETRLLVTDTTSHFDVDFGQKSVVGSIKVEEGKNIILHADIKGTKFENWGGFNDLDVNGAFYGKNAEELAGTYSLDSKLSGTFGAKRIESKPEEKPETTNKP